MEQNFDKLKRNYEVKYQDLDRRREELNKKLLEYAEQIKIAEVEKEIVLRELGFYRKQLEGLGIYGGCVDKPIETRSKGCNEEDIDIGLENRPTNAIAYFGEVYRYDLWGNFVEKYKNSIEAERIIRIEKDNPKLKCKDAIGYCCTGTYNIGSPKTNRFHRYRDTIWFNRKLTQEEIDKCFELEIFNKK
ncbi:hypothetical protein QTH49_13425 [Clostridium perfringens]|nr:hypothetical protein [Clostridium perfringens]